LSIKTTIICSGLVQTGMFAGVRVPYPFLTPPLHPDEVVAEIIDALISNTRNEVWTPWAVYAFLIMRWLPVTLADRLQKVRS
jgi:short-subunit dehydrogenase